MKRLALLVQMAMVVGYRENDAHQVDRHAQLLQSPLVLHNNAAQYSAHQGKWLALICNIVSLS